MFALFPTATLLLHALKEDFVSSVEQYQKEVSGDNEKYLSSPGPPHHPISSPSVNLTLAVLKCKAVDELFKLPIPETSKVILNIVSTKYRQKLRAGSLCFLHHCFHLT